MAEAQQRLDITGFPFVFFADDSTGRGNVLYHRYDGHYGRPGPDHPRRVAALEHTLVPGYRTSTRSPERGTTAFQPS